MINRSIEKKKENYSHKQIEGQENNIKGTCFSSCSTSKNVPNFSVSSFLVFLFSPPPYSYQFHRERNKEIVHGNENNIIEINVPPKNIYIYKKKA